LYFSLYGTGRR